MGGYRVPGWLGSYDEQELVCRLPSPGQSMHRQSASGRLSTQSNDQLGREFDLLRENLSQLEVQANQFAIRFIQDSNVRLNYLAEIKTYSDRMLAAVRNGEISVHEAHLEAHNMRNTILESSRLKSSDIGRAYAEGLKKQGRTLQELYAKYAKELFEKNFEQLDDAQRNMVKLKIIEKAGSDQLKPTRTASRFGRLGKGLWVLTIGIAVYNVATAEDKTKATAHEVATLGGGVLGGAAAGAAAGLVCGPGFVVCSSVLVIAGGALGALGMDYVFDWVWE